MEIKTKETLTEADRVLVDALKAGRMARVEEAIYKGADPCKGGYKLLELSMRKGKKEIAQILMERATKKELSSFAMEACINRQLTIVLELEKRGTVIRVDARFLKENQKLLTWIITTNIKAKVVYDAFQFAQKKLGNSPELLNNLIILMRKNEEPEKNQNNLNFLMYESAKEGRLDLVRLYENRGANIKSFSQSDIQYIKKKGEWEVIAHLEKRGVKIGSLI